MIDESFPRRLNVNYTGYEIVIGSDDRFRARELIYPTREGGRERGEDGDRFDRGEYLTLRVRAIGRDNNRSISQKKTL